MDLFIKQHIKPSLTIGWRAFIFDNQLIQTKSEEGKNNEEDDEVKKGFVPYRGYSGGSDHMYPRISYGLQLYGYT